MMLDLKLLEDELSTLTAAERLQLARWLVDSVLRDTVTPADPARSLLAMAGRFSGGPGDTAERAEEILEAEIGRDHFGAIEHIC
jgi:hypothetical protein